MSLDMEDNIGLSSFCYYAIMCIYETNRDTKQGIIEYICWLAGAQPIFAILGMGGVLGKSQWQGLEDRS